MAQISNEKVSEVSLSTGRKPDFKGDGVAVWKNKDKNGKEYLAVKILGGITIHAFQPKEEVEKTSSTPKSEFATWSEVEYDSYTDASKYCDEFDIADRTRKEIKENNSA